MKFKYAFTTPENAEAIADYVALEHRTAAAVRQMGKSISHIAIDEAQHISAERGEALSDAPWLVDPFEKKARAVRDALDKSFADLMKPPKSVTVKWNPETRRIESASVELPKRDPTKISGVVMQQSPNERARVHRGLDLATSPSVTTHYVVDRTGAYAFGGGAAKKLGAAVHAAIEDELLGIPPGTVVPPFKLRPEQQRAFEKLKKMYGLGRTPEFKTEFMGTFVPVPPDDQFKFDVRSAPVDTYQTSMYAYASLDARRTQDLFRQRRVALDAIDASNPTVPTPEPARPVYAPRTRNAFEDDDC